MSSADDPRDTEADRGTPRSEDLETPSPAEAIASPYEAARNEALRTRIRALIDQQIFTREKIASGAQTSVKTIDRFTSGTGVKQSTVDAIRKAIASYSDDAEPLDAAYFQYAQLIGSNVGAANPQAAALPGAYFVYRVHVPSRLIQVSGLDIYLDSTQTILRFKHHHKTPDVMLSVGLDNGAYDHRGHVFAVNRTLFLLSGTYGYLRQMILELPVRPDPRFPLLGVVSAMTSDLRQPFAARVLVLRQPDRFSLADRSTWNHMLPDLKNLEEEAAKLYVTYGTHDPKAMGAIKEILHGRGSDGGLLLLE